MDATKVYILSVEPDGSYHNADLHMYGSTVRVELQRGDEVVGCGGIATWDLYELDEDDEDYDAEVAEELQEELQELFEEWKQLAADGEEGCTHKTL